MHRPLVSLVDRVPVTSLRQVHTICDPGIALGPEDQDRLWVDLFSARGGNRFDRIEQAIRSAPSGAYLSSLVTGHPGAGKSTELLRLSRQLQQLKEGKRFHVVYLDATRYLDLTDVRLPDLLAAFLPALVSDSLLQVPRTKTAAALWKRFKKAAAEAGVELAADLSDAAGVPALGRALKLTPHFAAKLRASNELEVSRLVTELSDLLAEVRAPLLRSNQDVDDLVIIVDNLEKMERREIPGEPGKTNHHVFFLEELPRLRALNVHLVVTFPLVFALQQLSLRFQVSVPPVMVPMVRVRQRPPDEGFDAASERPDAPDGFAAMREMLARRLDLSKIFAGEDAIDCAIRWSGGCTRDLLRLVSSASLRQEDRPITKEDIDAAALDEVNAFERVLQGKPFLTQLHEVERTGAFPTGFDENDRQWLLYQLVVAEYDTGTWYDVHPFARATRAYRLAAPRPSR